MLLRMLPSGLDGKRYIPIAVSLLPWLAVCSFLIAIFAVVKRRVVLAVVSVVCVVAQIGWHVGFFKPSQTLSEQAKQAVSAPVEGALPDISDAYARIMTFNTKGGQASADEIVQTVRTEHVEVLAMQEVSQNLLGELASAGISGYLPYYVVAMETSHDNGGVNVLYSAAPMWDAVNDMISTDSSSIPGASVNIGGKCIRFGSMHPFSPRPSNQGLWSSSLDSLAQLKNYSRGDAYVLMGDFNSTWDHSSFRYLLGNRFVDSGEQAGEGFHMTYPAKLPIAEIDHIIHDKNVCVGDLATKKISGSDHLALLGTLEVK